MTSIIEDFRELNIDLSRLERARMPDVKPDFAAPTAVPAADCGDVTDQARKEYYGLYGWGFQGDSGDETGIPGIIPLVTFTPDGPVYHRVVIKI